MSLRPDLRANLAVILLSLSVLVPFSVYAAATQEILVQTKDAFNQLWHSAAETTKRRATLEQNLASFDDKVESAKQELLKAATDRRDIKEKVARQEELIAALGKQMQAADATRGFYESVALSRKDDIVGFVRYVEGKRIAKRESGSVTGGVLVQRLLRGSLGDSVDQSLAESALLQARQRFAQQVDVLLNESDKAQSRLTLAMTDLQNELGSLQQENKRLGDSVDQKLASIDERWRQKKLTEEELKHVADETAESEARISAIQANLLQINEELKDAKRKELSSTLTDLQKKLKTLQDQKLVYERKDQAMVLLEDAALRAFQLTITTRNTDRNLYRHVDEVELKLKNLQADLAALPRDASGALLSSDGDQLKAKISILKDQLVLMREGTPEDVALDYVLKRRSADDGALARKDFNVLVIELNKQIATQNTLTAAKQAELDAVNSDGTLEGMPSMFLWPVKGPITAGYYDPDYQLVFHVPHKAIDIAVLQGTEVHTVSEGIVYAVKDGGATGFSYILIGHQNGYASLYGHVSMSFVKKGDHVGYGQVIGLSGGEPGSHGAGPMTTGSHLHLEMTKDGQHFNPLDVLPRR